MDSHVERDGDLLRSIIDEFTRLEVGRVIYLTGANAHGKTTLVDSLAQRCGYLPIYVGSLISNERKDTDSALGREIAENFDRKVLPADLVLRVLLRHLRGLASLNGGGLILEGIPRSMDQLDYLTQIWRMFPKTLVVIIRLLAFSEVLRRSRDRAICNKCLGSMVSGRCVLCGNSSEVRNRAKGSTSEEVLNTFIRYRYEGGFILALAKLLPTCDVRFRLLAPHHTQEEWLLELIGGYL